MLIFLYLLIFRMITTVNLNYKFCISSELLVFLCKLLQ